MSDNIAIKQARKDETQNSGSGGGRKTSLRPPEQILKCPRCDSTNTKFCYYNNYNLTQPRHFCKACRRYWTKGGALRNIPVGGGCRKTKKTKSCTSKFLIGDSSSHPVMDFHLGGINFPPRINHFSSTNNLPFMNLDPLGFNATKQSGLGLANNFQEVGFTTYTNLHQTSSTNLTSSIESLSSLNQDLHWKLQQERFATMIGGRENDDHHPQQQKETGLQPILFQNLDISSKPPQSTVDCESRKDGSSSGDGGAVGGLATEWFFDNNYAPVNMISTSTGHDDQNGSINNWNGIQTWSHMNQYNALP